MANQIRIKRRASTGSAGAPSSLKNAELAFNEADNVLYYGYGDDGSGNATSIIGIGGDGSVVSVSGTQTVTGDKTLAGAVDLTGAFKIDGVEVTSTASELNILDGATLTTVELNYLDGVTSAVQTQIDTSHTKIHENKDALGIADGTSHLGIFAGSIISDNTTVKVALGELESHAETADATASEIDANVDDLISLSGVLENSTDMGDYTGTTVPSNGTVKENIQALETSVETKAASSTVNTISGKVDSLVTLSGLSANAENLGTFTGSTISDNRTVKQALQDLETELEDGAGALAGDTGSADFAGGSVTVSGGTGLTTSASLNTLTVNLDSTAVGAGSYGAADTVPTYTVDAQGRLTAASDVSVSIVHTQVSDFDAGVQANRLDQMSVPTADISLNNNKITGLAEPTGDTDAATKGYVDANAQGLDVKQSVLVASTGPLTLSGEQSIDGVSVTAGARILVKDQSSGSENGIYDVASGAWSRSADADESSEVNAGVFVFVEEGATNADAGFVLTTDNPITIDTTPLSFTQFSGAGQVVAGDGLTKSGNQIDVVGTANRIVVNANNVDLATHGTSGTYNGLTVDAYGRVSSFSTPTTLAGYSISDAQPLDATLTALAGVTFAADEMVYATADDTFATTSITSYARSLLADANASAARSTLGLGTMAVQNANNINVTGGTIDGCSIDGGTF
jgi:phage-related tail fiber protein